MSFKKYFERIKYIDSLIRKKASGGPLTLARKLGLSKRAILLQISEMKELGFPIKYGRNCDCYFYEENGEMIKELFLKELTKNDMQKIKGGDSVNYFFFCQCKNNALVDFNFTFEIKTSHS